MSLTTVQSELFYLPGVTFEYWGLTAPNGWVFASGQSIGNASSNASLRANADTYNLFAILWQYPDSVLVMYNSSGTIVTRGSSASADYALNYCINVPDCRGRARIGRDNMGGPAANRITSGGSGILGTQPASSGGAETHQLVTSELPSHTHGSGTLYTGNNSVDHVHPGANSYQAMAQWTAGAGAAGGTYPTSYSGAYNTGGQSANHNHNIAGGSTGGTGSDGTHLNVQPTIICNVIIKL